MNNTFVNMTIGLTCIHVKKMLTKNAELARTMTYYVTFGLVISKDNWFAEMAYHRVFSTSELYQPPCRSHPSVLRVPGMAKYKHS